MMTDNDATGARRKEIGQERREKTRQKLLASAARVVAERGEKKATIDDFIQAAGVARGTFYNYYSTRNDLLDDLWAQIGRDPFRAIQQACADIEDHAERLVARARLVLACALDDPTWGWLIYALSADAETVNSDLMDYPRPDLQAGLAAGRFRFADIDSASDLIVGAVRTALRATLGDTRPDGYAEALGTLLLRAVGIPCDEADLLAMRPLPSLVR